MGRCAERLSYWEEHPPGTGDGGSAGRRDPRRRNRGILRPRERSSGIAVLMIFFLSCYQRIRAGSSALLRPARPPGACQAGPHLRRRRPGSRSHRCIVIDCHSYRVPRNLPADAGSFANPAGQHRFVVNRHLHTAQPSPLRQPPGSSTPGFVNPRARQPPGSSTPGLVNPRARPSLRTPPPHDHSPARYGQRRELERVRAIKRQIRKSKGLP